MSQLNRDPDAHAEDVKYCFDFVSAYLCVLCVSAVKRSFNRRDAEDAEVRREIREAYNFNTTSTHAGCLRNRRSRRASLLGLQAFASEGFPRGCRTQVIAAP